MAPFKEGGRGYRGVRGPQFVTKPLFRAKLPSQFVTKTGFGNKLVVNLSRNLSFCIKPQFVTKLAFRAKLAPHFVTKPGFRDKMWCDDPLYTAKITVSIEF